MRVPQYPQNGSPLSAGLVQRGHRVGTTPGRTGDDARGGDAGVGGAMVRAAVADPDAELPLADDAGVEETASFPATTAPPPALPPVPTCAAEAVIGFPQSMQNRDDASFSRPQKEQAVNRLASQAGKAHGARI